MSGFLNGIGGGRTSLMVGIALAACGAARGEAQDRPAEPVVTMTIGRLHYDGGGDWYANPSSLPNLLQAIATRTRLRVAARERVVRLVDDELWSVPYLHMTGHGNFHLSDAELVALRR